MNFELTPQSLFGSLTDALNANLKQEIAATNEKSIEYGLTLTPQDAQMLIAAGNEALSAQDRVEIGKSATVKLIERFMQSTYIRQRDYAQTIAELLEVFYAAKEECGDVMNDDEVIGAMFAFFERESGGDVDALCSRDMERLCRSIRSKAYGYTAAPDESAYDDSGDEDSDNDEIAEWEKQ